MEDGKSFGTQMGDTRTALRSETDAPIPGRRAAGRSPEARNGPLDSRGRGMEWIVRKLPGRPCSRSHF
jgi:hypothetical protein